PLSSALGSSSSSGSGAMRLDAIRRAQVWRATNISAMDIKTGPAGPGAFAAEETVNCTYLEKKMTGRSPKFTCVIPPDDEVKVKFGHDNGEVYAEVAATRLLWALGFGADRMYPVKVVCKGCPAQAVGTDVAVIERKMTGTEIESDIETGWAWRELDLVDPEKGGAPLAHRDALKLLAVFLQHTDSKAVQQRLLCLDAKDPKDKADAKVKDCKETFMLIQDTGLTFGHATGSNRSGTESTSLQQWAATPIWKDPARCVTNMRKSMTGTLKYPTISEEGRKFLAGLLTQLTDQQLRDLFEVARFARRPAQPDRPATTTDQWVEAFKRKRTEIVDHVCPS
ncbi:MAG TPA: hypothetical protein VMZ90_02165, partial [Vicinamibacterales bacterium]|nr:hypothetical protein [Vicinamibacterales bacterium]